MALRFLLTLTGPRPAARVAAAPMPSPDADAGRPGNGNAADARPALPAPPATTILVAIFASLLFFYAGGESAIGGWIAEHVRRMEAGQTQHWTIAPMVFWAALAAGRLLTPLLLRAVDESHVLVAALVMLLATSTVLALATSVPVALLAAAVAGFCLAPVFPITFADLSRTLGPLRPRAVGPAYAMANVGSAVLPWLVGLCSTRFGTLRAGFVVPIASAAAMLALTAIRIARRRGHGTARQDGEDITHTPQ